MFSSVKSPGDVVAEVVMCRQTFDGSFLIVEGDDDSLFWKTRTHPAKCQIIIAGGKRTAIAGIGTLTSRLTDGVLAVVDDDCDCLTNRRVSCPNLFYTDARDLESLLLRSHALERVLAEHGNPRKILALETKEQKGLRAALIDRALPFGLLRWVSVVNNLNVPFERLSPFKYIDDTTW